jgi:hypothetical protein
MAGLFEPGKARGTRTIQPGAPSPASSAIKLFALKLALAKLAATGGNPQQFGDFLKHGYRQNFDRGQLQALIDEVTRAASQPNAFQTGPTIETSIGQPASPSTFQDISQGAIALALLNSVLSGSGGGGGTAGGGPGLLRTGSNVLDWLFNRNNGTALTPEQQSTGIGQTPIDWSTIGMPQSPAYDTGVPYDSGIGQTLDPNGQTPVDWSWFAS